MSELIQLFSTIAAIDSPSGEESSMTEYVASFLEDLGLSPTIDSYGMVFCRIGDISQPSKLFSAHLDTVEPGRGIKVVEENGYLVSAGETILGGDNKVSVAAILQAIRELLSENITPNIELLFTVREETNSGISQFDTSKIQSKVGFVFDIGNYGLNPVVQPAPFIQDFEVTIKGASAHASKPELAKNVLSAFDELLSNLRLGRPDENSTLNIGKFSGGDATNTIPGKMTFVGDLRSVTKEDFEKNKAHFEGAIAEAQTKTGCKIDLTWIPYAFGYTLDLQSNTWKELQNIYAAFSIELNPLKTTSGSDAGYLNYAGIETYCLGDGVENAHRTDERIAIETFEKLKEIVKKIMKSDTLAQ